MSLQILFRGPKLAASLLTHAAGCAGLLLLACWLRGISLQPDPVLQGYSQIMTGLLAFVFAAVSLVRFQGTQDRISLILGIGFLLLGAVQTATSVLFFQLLRDAPVHFLWAPVAWWVSRTLFALLLIVALLVERFLPRSLHPAREIVGALVLVIALTYLITSTLKRLPAQVSPHLGAWFPDSQQLLPGVIFLLSVVWCRRRLWRERTAFDRAIYATAYVNLAAQLAASQSEQLLDAPFALAQGLTVIGYVAALAGGLLDNARLFHQVHFLSVSDPLTGLANYRKLLDVLDKEAERSDRSGRPFSILLMDVDGLKKINDTYGHLVGSRAICRLADILKMNSRTIDTAARYGGDEFVLVLADAPEREAMLVAQRIQEIMLNDAEDPKISASIGVAVYRGDNSKIEKLLSAADQDLYAEKPGEEKRSMARTAG